MRRIVVVYILVVALLALMGSWLAGCTSLEVVKLTATSPSPRATLPAATKPPVATATASFTPTPRPTETQTSVPSPTASLAPTASPTTTSFPWGTVPITETTALQVRPLSVWGRGTAGQVWSADAGRLLLVLTPFGLDFYVSGSLEQVASLPDANHVIISEDTSLAAIAYPGGLVEVWEMGGLQRLFQFQHNLEIPKYPPPGYDEDQQLTIQAMAFSPDQNLLAIGYGDGLIDLYRQDTGLFVRSMVSTYMPFPAKLMFSPDGRYLLSVNQDPYFRFARINIGIWTVDTGEIAAFIPDTGIISEAPFSPQGDVLVTSKLGGFLLRYSLPDGQFLGPIPTGIYFPSVDYGLDGLHLVVDGGQQVRRISDGALVKMDGDTLASIIPPLPAWRVDLPDEQQWALGYPSGLFALRFGPGTSLYAWGQSGAVTYRWDLTDMGFQPYPWQQGPWGVAVSYDQKTLATCLPEGLWVMALDSGQVRDFGPCEPGYVDFSPAGGLLAKSYLQRVHILTLPDGELVHHLRGHSLTPQLVRYGPGGEFLVSAHASGGQWEAILWRTEPAAMIRRIDNEEWSLQDLALAPDAAYLVTAGDKLRIWRMSDGWQEKILEIGASRVAFSPWGDLVAAGDWQGNIHLVAVPSGHVLAVLEGHRDMIVDLRFSPDGSSLASASRDGTVRLWGVDSSE